MYKRRNIFYTCIVIIISSLIFTGCSNIRPSEAPTPNLPQDTNQPKPAPSNNTDSSKNKEPASMRILPDNIILSPEGVNDVALSDVVRIHWLDADEQEVAISGDALHYDVLDDSRGIIRIDENGILHIDQAARSGDSATIQIAYGSLSAQLAVKVRYGLEETVSVGASGLAVLTNAEDMTVLVNKQRNLPSDYVPPDLVQPNIPFSFEGDSPKKKLRKEAAEAVEQLFAAAKKDGIELYGVSGYRSYATQKSIFENNVKKKGEKEANRYSAYPGQSEHQTGLALDVSSRSAGFALEEVFGETKEGKWLRAHASDFGFIIRYPKDKESITGYAYEPWHIRYLGETMAGEIAQLQIALEQYFDDSIPVNSSR